MNHTPKLSTYKILSYLLRYDLVSSRAYRPQRGRGHVTAILHVLLIGPRLHSQQSHCHGVANCVCAPRAERGSSFTLVYLRSGQEKLIVTLFLPTDSTNWFYHGSKASAVSDFSYCVLRVARSGVSLGRSTISCLRYNFTKPKSALSSATNQSSAVQYRYIAIE